MSIFSRLHCERLDQFVNIIHAKTLNPGQLRPNIARGPDAKVDDAAARNIDDSGNFDDDEIEEEADYSQSFIEDVEEDDDGRNPSTSSLTEGQPCNASTFSGFTEYYSHYANSYSNKSILHCKLCGHGSGSMPNLEKYLRTHEGEYLF